MHTYLGSRRAAVEAAFAALLLGMLLAQLDGTVVTIMYNKGDAAANTVLSVDGTMYQVSIPAHGWATVNKKGA